MVLNPIADTDYFDEHGCLEKKLWYTACNGIQLEIDCASRRVKNNVAPAASEKHG